MVKCISVEKKFAECAIRVLKERGFLNRGFEVTRTSNRVLIPVEETRVEEALKELAKCGGDPEIVECEPPRKKLESVSLPSLDIVDNVVIVRENALRHVEKNELINMLKKVYPRIRAVWIKKETIDAFRTPVLELLWGEEVREIVAKEHGLKFRVKLGHVYFNPRLGEEHHRLAVNVKPGEVVMDMFCGVGGFAIHVAATTPSLVIANDINPVAYELLLENIALNMRRLKGTIIPLNLDSKSLVEVVVRGSVDRVIADFPTGSLDFVEVYDHALKPGGVLHLYLVAGSGDDAKRLVLEKLNNWRIHLCLEVLEYSPRLSIYRCDLVKPEDV